MYDNLTFFFTRGSMSENARDFRSLNFVVPALRQTEILERPPVKGFRPRFFLSKRFYPSERPLSYNPLLMNCTRLATQPCIFTPPPLWRGLCLADYQGPIPPSAISPRLSNPSNCSTVVSPPVKAGGGSCSTPFVFNDPCDCPPKRESSGLHIDV